MSKLISITELSGLLGVSKGRIDQFVKGWYSYKKQHQPIFLYNEHYKVDLPRCKKLFDKEQCILAYKNYKGA